MSSTAQRKANRANAAHSSGPTSAAGRATCSQNGLKHGLASSQLIIRGENEEEFNTMLSGLLAHHQPANITETMLVQDMAKHHWLADRALRMQNHAITLADDLAPASLGILIRYHTANERAYQKALAALNALRKTQLAEIGSASKKAAQAAKKTAAAADAVAKLQSAQRLAAILRSCEPPPTVEQLLADGFHENLETGNWEKTIG
jgi:hypothetical protein